MPPPGGGDVEAVGVVAGTATSKRPRTMASIFGRAPRAAVIGPGSDSGGSCGKQRSDDANLRRATPAPFPLDPHHYPPEAPGDAGGAGEGVPSTWGGGAGAGAGIGDGMALGLECRACAAGDATRAEPWGPALVPGGLPPIPAAVTPPSAREGSPGRAGEPTPGLSPPGPAPSTEEALAWGRAAIAFAESRGSSPGDPRGGIPAPAALLFAEEDLETPAGVLRRGDSADGGGSAGECLGARDRPSGGVSEGASIPGGPMGDGLGPPGSAEDASAGSGFSRGGGSVGGGAGGGRAATGCLVAVPRRRSSTARVASSARRGTARDPDVCVVEPGFDAEPKAVPGEGGGTADEAGTETGDRDRGGGANADAGKPGGRRERMAKAARARREEAPREALWTEVRRGHSIASWACFFTRRASRVVPGPTLLPPL